MHCPASLYPPPHGGGGSTCPACQPNLFKLALSWLCVPREDHMESGNKPHTGEHSSLNLFFDRQDIVKKEPYILMPIRIQYIVKACFVESGISYVYAPHWCTRWSKDTGITEGLIVQLSHILWGSWQFLFSETQTSMTMYIYIVKRSRCYWSWQVY